MLSVLHVHLGVRDGGAERQTAVLLAGLSSMGHRVLGIVRHGTPIEKRALEHGAPIFPMAPRFPLGPGGILTLWSRRRARAIVASGGWDLVHFHDPASLALAGDLLLRAAPGGSLPPSRRIVTYRGQSRAGARKSPASLRRHHREGGTIVAASEALWAALVREGYDEDLLSFIHPGIDMKAFSSDAAARTEARRRLGFDDAVEVVGTVGILDRPRGMDRFLEASATLLHDRPAARFLVAGDGPGRGALESRAERLGLGGKVLFTGWREDVAEVLPALDVYVFPGEGEEVFPISLIEAMAAGVPVVVSDQPGIREIIENGKQGLFVPEKGAESMARTILRVLTDTEVSRRMGRAGSVRVQRFHARAMVDAFEALYYRVSKIARER